MSSTFRGRRYIPSPRDTCLRPPCPELNTTPMPSVVDLFCGAGGLTAALEVSGWSTVAAVDHDKTAIAALTATQAAKLPVEGQPGRVYLEGTKLLCGDIGDVRGRDLRPAGAGARWRPDLLAGGPPCQPFSSAGRQRGLEDPRGPLFHEFVRLAGELNPRFILFENVRGLLTAKTPDGRPGGVLELVQQSFEELGYACRFAVLNASDYGAAQRRVRLFMIASRAEQLPDFPTPSHSRDAQGDLLGDLKPWVTLGEFLTSREQIPIDEAHVVRPSAARLPELSALEPGTGLRSAGIVEANRPGGHWGYRQDCFVADPGLPARTIRAASTPDWIKLPDGSLRRLTWRECAALQGFPEGWRFQGGLNPRFRQIGNAVQGDVGRAIGRVLFDAASEVRRARPVSPPWPSEFHRRVRYTVMEHAVNGRHREAARQGRFADDDETPWLT